MQYIYLIDPQHLISKIKLPKKLGVEGSLVLIIYVSLGVYFMPMYRNKKDPSLVIEVPNMLLVTFMKGLMR